MVNLGFDLELAIRFLRFIGSRVIIFGLDIFELVNAFGLIYLSSSLVRMFFQLTKKWFGVSSADQE